jgi:hypothetical protein
MEQNDDARQAKVAHMRAIGTLGGLTRAARYDGREMTAKARDTFRSSFERAVRDRFPDLQDEGEIARRAEAERKLWYCKLGYKSAAARRAKARQRPPSVKRRYP